MFLQINTYDDNFQSEWEVTACYSYLIYLPLLKIPVFSIDY